MPKAYWVVRVDVMNPSEYQKYVAANAEPLARHGGRFLVRGGHFECMEGGSRARNIVLEFPSLEAAKACYADPGYQRIKSLREGAAVSDLIVIEGYDGPQPGT